jgi:hypothetical protein
MNKFDSTLGGSSFDDIWSEEELNKALNPINCFTPPPLVEFIEPKLDFELNPDHFIKWIKAESKNNDFLDAPTGESYAYDVSSMCEYSCLYISMLLSGVDLKGELRLISGNYGFWEHYWMEYTLDDIVYYIDLTLQQFDPTSPKLAISIRKDVPSGYNREFDVDGTSIEEYLEDKRAFKFYVDPKYV